MKKHLIAAALLAGLLTLGCSRNDAVFTKDPMQVMTDIASVVACKKVTYTINLPTSSKTPNLALTLYDSQLTTNNTSTNTKLAKECARRLLTNLSKPEQFQYVTVHFTLSAPKVSQQNIETYRFSTASL